MAELIFRRAGAALGARLAPAAFRSIGAALGRAAGSRLGARLDDLVFARTRRIERPRMEALQVQASQESASMPVAYGRVRIAGQVIWAARLKERREVVRSGGGKGGGGTRAAQYRYTLSFAVGLCEGPIARIERAWANGQPFDLAAVAHRVHTGGEDQSPDPLIEAIEGVAAAPAYRGLGYVVFEDLPLDDFGDVLPQLSFEVVSAPPGARVRLETMARGVCLIPGTGEFAYACEPVRRVIAAGHETTENAHADHARANLPVALDRLQADLPHVETVSLVSAWFGDDLRCGACTIRPGVEIAAKETRPLVWRAGGVDRAGARVVSQIEGAPAFGGTPSDESLVQAIAEMKARGLGVGLNPFLMMDIPPGNVLPDPRTGAPQAAFPWRGRITCLAADDGAADAAAQVAAFFGAATAADFSIVGGAIHCAAADWGYRRFILHHAHLAVLAGGVDFFIIGSELRGLTAVRGGPAHFPAVDALKTLAADVRAILGPATKITYAADWTEYAGLRPQDGSGDVFFHLDPLWADANIDAVGIDWYPPLTDWRDGETHADRALARTPYDGAYLQTRIEGGEAYDWFYAGPADRDAQIRTPITDGAHGKPWVFRAKDVRRFWSEPHFDRPGGVESATPTAWTPRSKPIWLLELGVPAIDKGANAPNLFIDARSAESAAPAYSDRSRDDLIQRRALEAYLAYWGDDVRNPVSDIYGGRMIDVARTCLWAWDARPYPHFPARADVWSDGPNWRLGHWLNGHAGAGGLREIVEDIFARAGVDDVDASALNGIVGGLVVDAPTTARAALEPLMAMHRFGMREHAGILECAAHGDRETSAVDAGDIVETAPFASFRRVAAGARPREVRLRYLDAGADYAVAAASARRRDGEEGDVIEIDAPMAMDAGQARTFAELALADAIAAGDVAEVRVAPSRLELEPGDRLDLSPLGDASGVYRIVRIVDDGGRRITLLREADVSGASFAAPDIDAPPATPLAPMPALFVLDLPPLPGRENDDRPLAAVAARPWTGAVTIYVGATRATATPRGVAHASATVGELVHDLWPGPVGRWDRATVMRVRLAGAALSSATDDALFAGANALAVRGADGWEIVQARDVTLVGPDTFDLRMLLRGQQGTESSAIAPAGAPVVLLDDALARLDLTAAERGEALVLVAPPPGLAPMHADARVLGGVYDDLWARPLAPCHVRGERDASGAVRIRWIRRARLGGDDWRGEPPPEPGPERWRVDIRSPAGALLRSLDAGGPEAVYEAGDQTADFGGLPGEIAVRVRQWSDRFGFGRGRDSLLRV